MADLKPGAFVLRPGEGRSIDMGTFAMSVKASAEETAGAFSLLEATEPAGFGPPMHIHRDAVHGRSRACRDQNLIMIVIGVA